ncbi:MAG: ASCH domain-containing protein [Solirubrobacterales bacterium]
MAELRKGEHSGLDDTEFTWEGSPFGDRLVELVLEGTKTATCSLLAEWEAEGREPPTPGSRTALIDMAGRERGVVEVTEVRVVPIREIDDDFARAEGEGFEDVAQWRAAHEEFWASDQPGVKVTDETMIVAERIRLVERFDQGHG